MAEEPENVADDNGGTLADAIAAHLALKKEHGADPDEVAREEASALGPADRDADDSVDLNPAAAAEEAPASEPEPEPGPAAEPAAEHAAQELEPEYDVEPAKPATEITGNFDFDFGGEPEPEPESELAAESAAETKPADAPAGHDPLEDTPDFFEETPEHDKLWFDEKPPKKFDF